MRYPTSGYELTEYEEGRVAVIRIGPNGGKTHVVTYSGVKAKERATKLRDLLIAGMPFES